MIDKVAVRVPRDAPYSPAFASLYQEIRNDPKGPFRKSQHYLAAADLRDYGYPVVLHTHCLHDKRGNHKVELIETGAMGYSRMRHEISRIFAVEVGPLAVMRLDLAADVIGIPVPWFEEHLRARYKRWTADIGHLDTDNQISRMGKRGIETVYLGKRPNVFRIYNKIAELQTQYARLKRRSRSPAGELSEIPTFEETFGYPETGFVLTRIERQIGNRIPGCLATLRALKNAAKFNPFESLVFVDVGKPEPNPDDYDLPTYCSGMYVRQMIRDQGFHRTRQFLNRKRNGARFLERLHDFLPPDDAAECSARSLLERYRESASSQLAV